MPRTAALLGVIAAVTVVAWVITARQADAMSDMVMGLGNVGREMPMGMAVVSFLAMWAVMMVAMMAPTIAPLALAHSFVRWRREEGAASATAVAVGYFVVWWSLGALYFLAFAWMRDLAPSAGESRWLPTLAGGLLILVGAYQFTPRKAHCLRACCSPLRFVTEHTRDGTLSEAFRTGLWHGVDCLGCCWAAMIVLLVVGLMNLGWMVGLSLLFLVEKHSARALNVSRLVGAALVVLGVAVVIHPDLLHAVSGIGNPPSLADAGSR